MVLDCFLEKLIFLGTGTSSCIPSMKCVTCLETRCSACAAACNGLYSPVESVCNRNYRRNTSVLLEVKPKLAPADLHENCGPENMSAAFSTLSVHENSLTAHILIDCGKTFHETVVDWFDVHKVKRIAAVLITHDHCDAMYGLPLLHQLLVRQHEAKVARKGGVFSGAREKINVYLSPECFFTLKSRFSQEFHFGDDFTGDCFFNFCVFESWKDFLVSFDFPATNFQGQISATPLPVLHGVDYFSWGFKIDALVYISDAVEIPQKTRAFLENLDVFILDALGVRPMKSHFTIHQSISEVEKLSQPPKKIFFTGLSHQLEHVQAENLAAEFSTPHVSFLVAHDGQVIFAKDARVEPR
eukprot:Sdes_comp18706_c0_seq1m9017